MLQNITIKTVSNPNVCQLEAAYRDLCFKFLLISWLASYVKFIILLRCLNNPRLIKNAMGAKLEAHLNSARKYQKQAVTAATPL